MFKVQHSRAALPTTLAALWLISACNWSGLGARPDPPTASVPAVAALPLEIGKRTHGRIDCDGGHCVRRYELALHSHGELLIRVEAQVRQSGDGLRAILEDPAKNVLARQISDESGRSFDVGATVRPGRYSLSLQSRSGELDYSVLAIFQTHPAPEESAHHPDAVAQRQGVESASRSAGLEPSGSSLRGSAKNPQIHFGHYRRYAFSQKPAQKLNAAPGAYIGNPFIDEQIQRAIRHQLADSGYTEVAVEQAQFLVSMHTGSRSFAYYTIAGVAYNTAYSSWYATWGGYGYVGGPLNTALHTDGTLVIDIIDIPSKELVWHGWATETTGWQDNDVVIHKAVREILSKFP